MKNYVLTMLLIAAACGTDTEAVTTANESTNPLHWMVGTWDCAGAYKDVAPFTARSVTAMYTAAEVTGQPNSIHGQYREPSGGTIAPINIDEVWSIGFFSDPTGSVETSISTALSTGPVAAGSGSLDGPSKSGFSLGSYATSAGTMSLPDGTSRQWKFGITALPTPTRFVADWSVETAPRSGLIAQYLLLTCTLRPDTGAARAAAAAVAAANTVTGGQSYASSDVVDLTKRSPDAACGTDTESMKTATATPDLCTADDPDCGAPGSNPDLITDATSTTADNYASQADPGSERISCALMTGGAIDCEASFNVLGVAFGGICRFGTTIDQDCECRVITTWSCSVGVPR